MREILFRGKRTDNEKWIEGSLFISEDKVRCGKCSIVSNYWIIENNEIKTDAYSSGNAFWVHNEFIQVIPETVGQYTGLTDKNGKKIFEGDIVVVNIKGYNTICKVAWADTVAQFQLWQTNTIPNTPTNLNLGNYDCEIIGNTTDNPELLKGGVDNEK